MKSKHRGPDSSSLHNKKLPVGEGLASCSLGFHHLRITDLTERGVQPFWMDDGSFIICNGEIYNHLRLREEYLSDHVFASDSDCEILLPLFKKFGPSFVDILDGEFSFILYSAQDRYFVVARDPIGIRPLYIAASDGVLQVASELKSIDLPHAQHFPPGHYTVVSDLATAPKLTPYFDLLATSVAAKSFNEASKEVRQRVEQAVRKRLSSQVPIGALLSGGIDSSGVAVLAAKHYGKQLETFTCLIEDLPNDDVIHARTVARMIGSKHHEIKVTLAEVFSTIDDLIGIIETHNMEMIPNLALIYLVGKYIRNNTNVRVLLDGTGPDEMLGGYWFFQDAPTPADFNQETLKQVREMHRTELLAERALACFGLETRYPYLDQDVVKYVAGLPIEYKLPLSEHTDGRSIEKFILRHALQDVLPESIVWRKKLGMTHGAGKNFENLFDQEIKRRMTEHGVAEDILSHDRIIGLETYYKMVFDRHFPGGASVECGVSAAAWRSDDPLAVWR